jgi:microcompartment protein CcmL/EutN
LSQAFGVLETTGWTPGIVALDAMEKAAEIELWQVELNDFLGVCIKIRGSVDSVRTAIDVGYQIAEQMQGRPARTVIASLSAGGEKAIESPIEFSPLIQQNVVKQPRSATQLANQSGTNQSGATPSGTQESSDAPAGRAEISSDPLATKSDEPTTQPKEISVTASNPQALGFIETQGFTAVFEAIDTACKAAQVDVVGKEKLGGGYITIVIRGDVAAVHAAIDAARPRVEGLGKLIAAHVIPRPSESVLGLLPK